MHDARSWISTTSRCSCAEASSSLERDERDVDHVRGTGAQRREDVACRGAIDVDTYQDRKLVVLRGSVPTQAQKQRAGMIAQDNAKSYRIDNQLAVVPK